MNKYKAKKVTIDGFTFDSLREGVRYRELRLLERAGEITNLELQPEFPLYCGLNPVKFESGRAAKYKADFRYEELSGKIRVEDVKGFDTGVSKLKRAMVKAHYGVTVELVK